MSSSPAVILSDIPNFLRSNGKTTASHILGSKTGVEVGACYWKLHPTMPRFMVVFKNKFDRDNWYNNSMKLNEMKRNGASVSTAWYSRDLDKVMNEEEGQVMAGGRKSGGGGGSYMKLLQERDRNASGGKLRNQAVVSKIISKDVLKKKNNNSVLNMSALSAEIEDLDKITLSHSFTQKKNKFAKSFPESPSLSIPPVRFFPQAASSPGHNVKSGQSMIRCPSPLMVNMSQDFSVPPPPLRLPLHVQPVVHVETVGNKVEVSSNILAKLEESVLDSLESDKENNNVGDMKQIAKAVASSWKDKIEHLEKIYESVLSEATLNIAKLTKDLAVVNKWEGEFGITEEQMLGWTKEFLVKAGMKAGSDTEERFSRFLLNNSSKFKISIDEIKFIMQRNGLDINRMCKAFSENSTSVGFRNFVKNSVSISGHLLEAFAGVFLDFFKSKMEEQISRNSRKVAIKQHLRQESKICSKGDVKDVSTKINVEKLNKLLDKHDVKGVKNVVGEIKIEMKNLASQNQLLEEKANVLMNDNNKMATEVKLTKEDFHEKVRAANQENKMLRARNTSLQDDLSKTRDEKDAAISRFGSINDFVRKFSEAVSGDQADSWTIFDASCNEVDDEVKMVKEIFRNILKSVKDIGNSSDETNVKEVKFVMLQDGVARNLLVALNKDMLIRMDMLEKEAGKKVVEVKFKQGKGKGSKNLRVENGMIHPPACGWSEREYSILTQEDESPGHLGQGCISTPGHSRRQESCVREEPMFPPHLGGPRIVTE